jgi:hypothetical protein
MRGEERRAVVAYCYRTDRTGRRQRSRSRRRRKRRRRRKSTRRRRG